MRLLVIEDNDQLAELICRGLKAAGFDSDRAARISEAEDAIQASRYGAMIVDLGLPDGDGRNLVAALRAKGDATPVLMLTARGTTEDKVSGLSSGADDYLVKPFAFAELVARVNAMTRRADINGRAAATKLTAADLEMDLIARTVHRAGHPIDLQAQEFRLLEYLMRNAGRAVTRTMLLEHVWKLNFDPRTNIVETHMSRLRAKLDRNHAKDLIHTIRGTGYILRAD